MKSIYWAGIPLGNDKSEIIVIYCIRFDLKYVIGMEFHYINNSGGLAYRLHGLAGI